MGPTALGRTQENQGVISVTNINAPAAASDSIPPSIFNNSSLPAQENQFRRQTTAQENNARRMTTAQENNIAAPRMTASLGAYRDNSSPLRTMSKSPARAPVPDATQVKSLRDRALEATKVASLNHSLLGLGQSTSQNDVSAIGRPNFSAIAGKQS